MESESPKEKTDDDKNQYMKEMAKEEESDEKKAKADLITKAANPVK